MAILNGIVTVLLVVTALILIVTTPHPYGVCFISRLTLQFPITEKRPKHFMLQPLLIVC